MNDDDSHSIKKPSPFLHSSVDNNSQPIDDVRKDDEQRGEHDVSKDEQHRRERFSHFFDSYVKSHLSLNRSHLTDLDVIAWNNPKTKRYPMGDVCYEVKQKDVPQNDWAKKGPILRNTHVVGI